MSGQTWPTLSGPRRSTPITAPNPIAKGQRSKTGNTCPAACGVSHSRTRGEAGTQEGHLTDDTLEQRGLLLEGGMMVDATIIHAPPSTKNQERKRDPEMHQTKKGNQWCFGMKVHVGADVNSGLVHTVSVTPANVSDINQLPHLVREHDRAVFGDKGYVNNELKRVACTLIDLNVTGHIFNRLNEVLPDAQDRAV